MLIQPAQTNVTNVTAYTSSVTPSGVEQAYARTAIPPVEEAEKSAGGQNQLFAPSPEDARSSQASSEDSDAQTNASRSSDEQSEPRDSNGQLTLSEEDQVILDQLKARDREVRVHEAAHASVGGRYAGSASFQFTRGPDGRNYATGGEVSISVSAVNGDPQATIEKARVIQAAALAPAEPSAQDRRVAAEASQLELSARDELRTAKAEEAQQEKADRLEREEAADEDDAAVEDSSSASEEQPVVSAPTIQASAGDSEETDSDAESDSDQEQPTNAREDLEKILLGSQGLLQQANQLGLVDPQNPYGKSGFLDVIA